MKSLVVAVLIGLGIVGCGAESPMSNQELDAMEYQSIDQELTVTSVEPVTVTTAEVVELGPGVLVPENGGEFGVDQRGKNKCTDEKQSACDSCISGCDGICSLPDGGGRTGSCVGLFCPTRCDVCQLSCYTSCGKGTPTIYK